MLQPVKTAFGQFMGRYYASLAPTTRPLQAFVARGLEQSIAWAPARMADAAEDMLNLWLRADTRDAPTQPPAMPVIIVAMARDYTPSGRDYTRQVADRQMVVIPGDPKARLFGLRAVAGSIRAQIVIFATDEPSARSLAAQLLLFLDAAPNRRFAARHRFAGQDMDWPVQIETPEVAASAIQSEARNLTILAIDLTLRAQIPLFDAPAAGQPHDGQGTPGTDDPAGYPVVQAIGVTSRVSGAAPPLREYAITPGEAP